MARVVAAARSRRGHTGGVSAFGPYSVTMDDASMVGLLGRVTGTVGPGLVGEVIVRVRGGAEHFLAYPADGTRRIERGTVVMVVEYLPPRTVYVEAAYDS
jgi:hypothetical protein